MAPKNKGKSAPASTAAAPALSLQKVALVVLTALLCLSLATKVQGLSPLYGPNKLYAGGLLPLSEVYEIGTLALLYVERPIGVIALFAYIGHAPSAGSWPWPRPLVVTPTGAAASAIRASADNGKAIFLFMPHDETRIPTIAWRGNASVPLDLPKPLFPDDFCRRAC